MVLFVDNAPHLAAAVITICVFGYISFGLRVYTRLRYAAWGIEDWCMTAAMPFFTILSVACIACAFTGVGAMNETLSLPGNEGYQEKGLFWFFLFEVFYCINIIPVKLSISLMLIRIAQGRKGFLWLSWIVMGMFTAMNLIAGLYIVFDCMPVSAAWNQDLIKTGEGRCNDNAILADIYYATTAVNIATDWITAFMPIPLLWNVHMNINSKISVAFVLGLGFFASLSAIIRLKYTVGLTNAENYLYAISDIVLWGYAENGLGVIVACMATLKPLFRRAFKLTSSDSKPTTNPGRHYGFASNARSTYTECEAGHELTPSRPTFDKYGKTVVSSKIGKDDDRSISDTESQREILHGQSDKKIQGIVVSRQVDVTSGP